MPSEWEELEQKYSAAKVDKTNKQPFGYIHPDYILYVQNKLKTGIYKDDI